MSFIPKAKLYLPVRRNAEVMDLSSDNGSELWETRRLISQRVEPGDLMILWPSLGPEEYDPVGGPEWPVKKVLWNADGIMELELALMILNPSTAVQDAFRDRVRRGWDRDLFHSKRLHTTDGDFDADMRNGEWYK